MTQTYNGINGNSVLPASGYYGPSWPSYSGSVIPQGLSVGGWSLNDRGVVQQTFLGASIRSFNMNGGFGDSSSSLSIDLINDEFNVSDGTSQGNGDDVYHNGKYDLFSPPIAGSPVFFKFGPNSATVEQAYRKTFDDTYGINTIGDRTMPTTGSSYNLNYFTELQPKSYVNLDNNQIVDLSSYLDNQLQRGKNHIVFGGILQSYLQNRGPGGNPLYSVQVTDPREILSNVILILNNYAGTTFNTQNVFNIYGFLEHNMTQETSGILQNNFGNYNLLTKKIDPSGYISYIGSMDVTSSGASPSGSRTTTSKPIDCWVGLSKTGSFGSPMQSFPVTGTGFSRRGPQGIPFYRIQQAVSALMSTEYELPAEYVNRGFGKVINFRGYNYVVDFGGLPSLPPLYFIDFDQINLLDLCLEICDVASRDLFVSLLPVINHPACKFLYDYNITQADNPNNIIAGIIRLDSIDRSNAPVYGAIKTYIDGLSSSGIFVENQDVGYELSNVTTDKFVVGAQEVDMYCFSSSADKDFIDIRQKRNGITATNPSWQQWTLETQLDQQVLPYYGTLGQHAITIPKGWGAYQQILLDTTGLNANGVGAYYVATEMELRCASISYDRWKSFLQQYNDIYLESLEDDDAFEGVALSSTANLGNIPPRPKSNNYGVTVPRSVFETYADSPFGDDGLPKSPCNPPYGYPLYYKRMTKLGIPEGGMTRLMSRNTSMITGISTLRGADASNYKEIINAQLEELEVVKSEYGTLSAQEQAYYDGIKAALDEDPPKLDFLNDIEDSLHKVGASLPRLSKKGTENALKVYNFLKKIADENLGKKFLVKIPQKVNLFYENNVTMAGLEYDSAPFGFKPRPISSGIGDEFSQAFKNQVIADRNGTLPLAIYYPNIIKKFLSSGVDISQRKYTGALRTNYNPITDKYEFNYTPTNMGGYFPFDLYANLLTPTQLKNLPNNSIPLAVNQLLVPQDATNFLNDNGRLSAYVRFDNSQDLSFGSMNSEDFTQQLITVSGMIPDVCEFLDNVGEDQFVSFAEADADRPDLTKNRPKQCAFVKCSVDEKFYMPPKTLASGLDVYGQIDENNPIKKVTRPNKIFIPCSGAKYPEGPTSNGNPLPPIFEPGTGVYIDSFRYIEYNFVPTSGTVTTSPPRLIFKKKYEDVLKSYVVKSEIEDLDTNHVYALITLPNKVIPTQDSRYRDSVNQKNNTYEIKHYLTADVVKGLPEFSSPTYAAKAVETNIVGSDVSCSIYSPQARSVAWLASKKVKSALQFGFPSQIQAVAPSPISPDLVVLPLISQDRCYGPWISSQVDPQGSAYVNIGGRVEFIKDENLAPWNYAGYELMNSAGVLQAQFANSLLLFSERGGFSFAGLPNASLGKALLNGGPLVTNISVDVSDAGIKTTYKMDLYTASFGKLQKQKQDMISKISRERQRLRDERNALIRKGIGKLQSTASLAGSINQLGNAGLGSTEVLNTLNNGPSQSNRIVASVAQYETQAYAPALANNNSSQMFGDTGTDPSNVTVTDNVHAICMGSDAQIYDTHNEFDDEGQRDLAWYNTGYGDIPMLPYSEAQHHPNIPNKKYVDYERINELYGDDMKFKDIIPPA